MKSTGNQQSGAPHKLEGGRGELNKTVELVDSMKYRLIYFFNGCFAFLSYNSTAGYNVICVQLHSCAPCVLQAHIYIWMYTIHINIIKYFFATQNLFIIYYNYRLRCTYKSIFYLICNKIIHYFHFA